MSEHMKELLMSVAIVFVIVFNVAYLAVRFVQEEKTIEEQTQQIAELNAEIKELRHEVVVLTDQKDALELDLAMTKEENMELMEELAYLHYVLDDPMALFSEKLVELSPEDEELLMKIAMAEAGNQGVIGKCLIMNVVLNRCEASGGSVRNVIYAPNQFYTVGMGGYDEECEIALLMVCAGWDGSQGAKYFCNQGYNDCASIHLFKFGSHYFGA